MDKIESRLLKLAMFFWVELPVLLARIFPQMANAMTDGQHLLRWPTIAALSPFVALTVGVVAELLQQDEIFTMSWIVIGVLTLIGVSSVQLGVFAFLGYVTADLLSGRQVGFHDDFVGNNAIPDSLESVLSMTTEYVLLFSGVVGIPMLVLGLRMLLLVKGFTQAAGVVGERIVHLAATLFAYHLWSQLVVGAIRTVFRIEAVNFPLNAATAVEEHHWLIVALPAAAVVFRWQVEARAFTSESLVVLQATTDRFASRVELATVKVWPKLGMRMVVSLVYLSCLIGQWWHFGATLLVLWVALVGRESLWCTPVGRLVNRIPLPGRIIAAIVITFVTIGQVPTLATERRLLHDGLLVPMIGIWAGLIVVSFLTAKTSKSDTKELPT